LFDVWILHPASSVLWGDEDWLDGYRFANHEFDGECIAWN